MLIINLLKFFQIITQNLTKSSQKKLKNYNLKNISILIFFIIKAEIE